MSKICGIIYGEPQSPDEGVCLRCDEPPVLLQLRLQMGGCTPPPTPPPALYFFSKFSSIPEPIHRRIVSAKRGVPALLNRASPLQTSSCQQKQSPYERDAYIIIRTLGLQMGQHPQPTAKKKHPPQQQPKTSTPPCSINKKQNPPLAQQQHKSSDSQRSSPPQQQQKNINSKKPVLQSGSDAESFMIFDHSETVMIIQSLKVAK